jgi:excisionase family DNA binding protein
MSDVCKFALVTETDPTELLEGQHAARLLGVSTATLRRWENAGKISAVRTLGGHRRFRRSDVEGLLNRK